MTPVRFPRRRVVPRSAVSRRAVQQRFPKLVGASCPEMPRGAAWCRAAPRFAELRGAAKRNICAGAPAPLTEPWPAADAPALRLFIPFRRLQKLAFGALGIDPEEDQMHPCHVTTMLLRLSMVQSLNYI